jgi:membrane-associated phospholipid phosphatase
LGLGIAGVLANTPLDESFQDWYDERVHSSGSDDFSEAVRWLGDGRIMIPVFAGAALLDVHAKNLHESLTPVEAWGNRCLRSVVVGGPPVIGLKYLLNASRPNDEFTSRWRPFDNPYSQAAVSGHAFIGAVPFINAAMMTSEPELKIALYSASFLPAWSRINDRKHYLSQAVFGWWLAYLSAKAVNRTEILQRDWEILVQPMHEGLALHAASRF